MLNKLHAMISEAWGLPLGQEKCVIERDQALDLIDDIRGQFPTEIAEATRLLDARTDFIKNAKQEADSIKRAAEEQARILIDEQEIMRISRSKSNEMLSHAETSTNELRRVAHEYIDNTMQQAEDTLMAALNEIKQTRQRFRNAAREASESPPSAPPTEPPKSPMIDFDLE